MLPVHTIVFPTDFSDNSERAFPLACSLARDCGARIVALHVVPPADQNPLVALGTSEEDYRSSWQALRQMQPPESDVHVEHRLESGMASEVILQVAQQVKAGLIIVGTHGRTGLGRLLVGSVAEQVLRGATCPVLAVKNGALVPRIRTILFPTDLSEASESALGVAFSLARDYHAHLIILQVASFGDAVPYGELERILKQSSGYRQELEDKLRQCQRPECKAEFRVEEGEPAEQIVRVSQEARCDLIVMGSHGRTGLLRLLMGSVAEKTLRNAPCPVLLVKHAGATG